jgi:ribosomal protein S18 acetylase RimI-like enzyme
VSRAAQVAAVERLAAFRGADLHDLCDAAEMAIREGGGFGWVEPPPRPAMERYWQGVLAVPERTLFVGRLDGVIAGSAQFVRPSRNNEARAFAAYLTTNFVAPWARGHGLARLLVEAVEAQAREEGYEVLQLHVRETQTAAIHLFEMLGYVYWGTNPYYARVRDRTIKGHYYYKLLHRNSEAPAEDGKGAGP